MEFILNRAVVLRVREKDNEHTRARNRLSFKYKEYKGDAICLGMYRFRREMVLGFDQ